MACNSIRMQMFNYCCNVVYSTRVFVLTCINEHLLFVSIALSSPAYQRSSSQLRQPHMERSHTNGYTPHGYPRHFHHRNMRMQAKDRFRQLAMIRSTNNPITMDKEEIKRIGTKLIVLFDYEAGMEDELTVEFSETLIADILTQTGSERIWAYCPRTDQCGYVPMSMVVPPVV